jgi:hypothetical protein
MVMVLGLLITRKYRPQQYQPQQKSVITAINNNKYKNNKRKSRNNKQNQRFLLLQKLDMHAQKDPFQNNCCKKHKSAQPSGKHYGIMVVVAQKKVSWKRTNSPVLFPPQC